jgi:hypothetical protein
MRTEENSAFSGQIYFSVRYNDNLEHSKFIRRYKDYPSLFSLYSHVSTFTNTIVQCRLI